MAASVTFTGTCMAAPWCAYPRQQTRDHTLCRDGRYGPTEHGIIIRTVALTEPACVALSVDTATRTNLTVDCASHTRAVAAWLQPDGGRSVAVVCCDESAVLRVHGTADVVFSQTAAWQSPPAVTTEILPVRAAYALRVGEPDMVALFAEAAPTAVNVTLQFWHASVAGATAVVAAVCGCALRQPWPRLADTMTIRGTTCDVDPLVVVLQHMPSVHAAGTQLGYRAALTSDTTHGECDAGEPYPTPLALVYGNMPYAHVVTGEARWVVIRDQDRQPRALVWAPARVRIPSTWRSMHSDNVDVPRVGDLAPQLCHAINVSVSVRSPVHADPIPVSTITAAGQVWIPHSAMAAAVTIPRQPPALVVDAAVDATVQVACNGSLFYFADNVSDACMPGSLTPRAAAVPLAWTTDSPSGVADGVCDDLYWHGRTLHRTESACVPIVAVLTCTLTQRCVVPHPYPTGTVREQQMLAIANEVSV